MKLSLATTLILSTLTSTTAEITTNPQTCINPSDYPANTDFFPDKFTPHSTTDLLSISYHNTYKIITNHFHNKTYLLYQCGTEPPASEVESGNHHLILSVPHTGKLGITETPQITPLEQLGLRREIATYIGNPKLISSPCLNYMSQNDQLDIIYYEDDPWNSTLVGMGVESYMVQEPELVVLVGPYGDVEGERSMGVAASQEKTAVATFDWLGLYAALYNLESTANTIITETESRYQCSADNSAILTADTPEESKPSILWAQYFQGIGWSIADCPSWDTAYYCEYAHHCGANIISRPENMGFNQSYDGGKTLYWYLTDEEFLEVGKDAGVWIYPSSTFGEVYSEKRELLDEFVSVQRMEVYDTQGQGSFSWHEQRLGEYDVVALDFCTLIGTNNPDTVHRRRWFRNYYIEPIGSAGSCDAPDEIDEPYVPKEASCTLIGSETKDAEVETESNGALKGEVVMGSFVALIAASLVMILW